MTTWSKNTQKLTLALSLIFCICFLTCGQEGIHVNRKINYLEHAAALVLPDLLLRLRALIFFYWSEKYLIFLCKN